ncbi:hypothetical protein [Halofilum ochraceum]|uniref:hypothetical protein n=1 Tax=Halofilum ochraceum TaxID=1611323 RepID=UPI000B05C1F3|nr:hypothetical protein [Halofilum ochraceum]
MRKTDSMLRKWPITALVGLALVALSTGGYAGKADVVDVSVEPEGDRTYRFSATVRHDDEGWDHYADRWEVLTPDGEVLDTRVLHHPHENEQPFTRSLGGVEIPAGISRVRIRARDSVHGYGGRESTVELP